MPFSQKKWSNCCDGPSGQNPKGQKGFGKCGGPKPWSDKKSKPSCQPLVTIHQDSNDSGYQKGFLLS